MSTLKLASLSVLLLFAGCDRVPVDDDRCRVMRQIGLSVEKNRLIVDWIEATVADPRVLASTGRKDGMLLAIDYDLGMDWTQTTIPADSVVVEFYGANVDYRNLVGSSVEAVIVGYELGYKLIYKLDPASKIEEKLKAQANSRYGEIRVESLGSDVTLVCQRGR